MASVSQRMRMLLHIEGSRVPTTLYYKNRHHQHLHTKYYKEIIHKSSVNHLIIVPLTHTADPKHPPILQPFTLPSIRPLIRLKSRHDLLGRHSIQGHAAAHGKCAAQVDRSVVRPIPMSAASEEAGLPQDDFGRHDGNAFFHHPRSLLPEKRREDYLLYLESVLVERRQL